MGNKQKKPQHQPFEGQGKPYTFLKITHQMLRSDAWNDLSVSARMLYIEFSPSTRKLLTVAKSLSLTSKTLQCRKANGQRCITEMGAHFAGIGMH